MILSSFQSKLQICLHKCDIKFLQTIPWRQSAITASLIHFRALVTHHPWSWGDSTAPSRTMVLYDCVLCCRSEYSRGRSVFVQTWLIKSITRPLVVYHQVMYMEEGGSLPQTLHTSSVHVGPTNSDVAKNALIKISWPVGFDNLVFSSRFWDN